MSTRPFQFMAASRGAPDGKTVAEHAQWAESVGFTHIATHDLIGGTRERVLRIAARDADIVGLDLRSDGEAVLDAFQARTDVRVGWIRDEAGDSLAQKDLNVLRSIGQLVVTDNALNVAADVAHELAAHTGQDISAHDILESPFAFIGSVPELVDKLTRLRQRWGINSFLVGWFGEPGLRDFAPVVEQLSGS